ncbi:MAG: putative porin [Bacteroidales bacterium]
MLRYKKFDIKITGSIVAFIVTVLSFNIAASQEVESDTLAKQLDSNVIKKELRFQLKERQKEQRDSLKALKDSIRWSKPRILETYIVADSLKYKRIILWNHNQYLNNIELKKPDTTFNDNFFDYPFLKKDVGATYLGTSGSATLLHNYFKREKLDVFNDFSPYLIYGYTPETLPFYNTKTPYTEMAYWGTLFANRDKEETNVKFLHTQNLSPSFNFAINYERFGASGLLGQETTDNRNFSISTNYLGKRYVMHGGYIYQSIKRDENGGIIDDSQVLDTLIDAKELSFNLLASKNTLKRNTFFLTQSYGVPIKFSKRDSLGKDSTKVGEGTITYFGHSVEFSTYKRVYSDEISLSDSIGRNFYHNWFYISPTTSYDSTRVNRFENKLFVRIQPWAQDAIVSKLDGGVGYQMLSVYRFKPEFYLQPAANTSYNNFYLYAGASGQFRKYFQWNAFGKYFITGYNSGDFSLDAKVRFSAYPIKEGIHLTGKLKLSNTSPDWFQNYLYSNHYFWNNNFSKTTETRVEGVLDIPKFKMQASFGYALVNNLLYYGTDGVICQHNHLESILTAYIKKDFKIWMLHFDNQILYQYTSNSEVIPLPTLSANLKYYLEFNVVKNVMRAQIGANVIYNTEYYAPSYSPALGQFHLQNDREIGDYPYIDAFINIQWKRASIFVKYINASQDWPDGDYFSANHYIRPQTAIKIGIHWPFYIF